MATKGMDWLDQSKSKAKSNLPPEFMARRLPRRHIYLNKHWQTIIYSEVKLAKKLFVWATVAFWVLMSSHCGLENVPGWQFLACSSPIQTTQHDSSGCGDDDACATVESGNYKSEESQVSAGEPSLTPIPFTLALLFDVPESSAGHGSPGLTPPELARSWQFSFRTALPPRAPSLLS